MNFLSHFYFERENPNDYIVMGVVLPDLIKNADKSWNLNPQKDEYLFRDVPEYNALLTGWKRHLEVDRLFHSSDFFREQTAILKQMILPAVQTGPVKAFFLAHIGLELVLDQLLLTHNMVDADYFYTQLLESRSPELTGFLRLAGLPDQQKFDKFLDEFVSSRYLFSYADTENITYSLNRICMRLWPDPFEKEQLDILNLQLEHFRQQLENNFLSIFAGVGRELNKIQ
jgi:acyl carrier protein phosphodiesterase